MTSDTAEAELVICLREGDAQTFRDRQQKTSKEGDTN
jgi:hypothetical protein